MAKSRETKEKILAQYENWLNKSRALVVTEYSGLNMKDLDAMRAKIREAGGEFHVVKNTLGRLAFQKVGIQFPSDLLEGSTGIIFAFEDPTTIAKTLAELTKSMEKLKVKGGILAGTSMTPEGVKSLASMPPLPVMRATLMGTILAPASKLVRTLAEPSRGLAAVVKAYADRDAAGAGA